MAPIPLLLPLLLLFLSSSVSVYSQQPLLTETYDDKNCPSFQSIVMNITTSKNMESPFTAPGTLRVFFHDCMVEGCDASVLISSNPYNNAERDAEINLSLPGDAFDLILRAKTALKINCPGIVSCLDILAYATRQLVVMTGGPYYKVPLGRKDGLMSQATLVEGNLPRTYMTMDQIISIFEKKGFSVQEMVALNGAHTVGVSHCSEFKDIIFGYKSPSGYDSALHPKFAERLRQNCANYSTDPTRAAFNDVRSTKDFDNMYFKNLRLGLGLLRSVHLLFTNPRTRPFVDLYADNQTAFFEAFSLVMEKLSVLQVKTGKDGEIRRRCDSFNTININ